MSIIPIVVLAIVFVLIAIRKVGNVKLHIWQIMLGGAIAVLLMLQISPIRALQAINIDVMLFLFGMFIVGEALVESGYLSHIVHKYFKRARDPDHLLLIILFGVGFLSAVLMNDTLAIIGTPVMLQLAKKYRLPPKALLLSLAFAVTIGSVMSPIGNPQNLLIAVKGNVQSPFVTFLKYLLVPTVVNLFIAYLFIKVFFKKAFGKRPLRQPKEHIKDEHLSRIARASLQIAIALIILKIIIAILAVNVDFRLTYIALLAAAPILVLSPKRFQVLKGIDWPTLVFFAAMFILMASVWDSGFFQDLIKGSGMDVGSLPMIFLTSVVVSQFISNVPFVALFINMIIFGGGGTRAMMALAAGSTIAGNLTILGAASNVIIIQNAEKKGETLTFFEFAKVGLPLTVINVLVYWGFLLLF